MTGNRHYVLPLFLSILLGVLGLGFYFQQSWSLASERSAHHEAMHMVRLLDRMEYQFDSSRDAQALLTVAKRVDSASLPKATQKSWNLFVAALHSATAKPQAKEGAILEELSSEFEQLNQQIRTQLTKKAKQIQLRSNRAQRRFALIFCAYLGVLALIWHQTKRLIEATV